MTATNKFKRRADREFAQGVEVWNEWRKYSSHIVPVLTDLNLRKSYLNDVNFRSTDLTGTDLSGASLFRANLVGARLVDASLENATLIHANLNRADLFGANLRGANLFGANLVNAKLIGADLSDADLSHANLSGVNLSSARLTRCRLLDTDLSNSNLSGCSIYGISAWGVSLSGANQTNLVITPPKAAVITVDNLEVAQFIYMLLNNNRIREVIEAISSKAVLILGRFTRQRMEVLEAIRERLRARNYLPILFDFEKPVTRDLTETVSTLAHISKFVIADLSDPRSVPHELEAIVPHLPSVPVQPILVGTDDEYAMFEHLRRYPWVLKTYRYHTVEDLILHLDDRVLKPPEAAARRVTRS